MPAALVDGIAHALKVAVEHTRQDGRLEPVAHRGGTDEIGEQNGHHFALGSRRLDPRLHPVGDEMLQHTGWNQPRAGLLEMLEVGGDRLELGFQRLVLPPLAIDCDGEPRQKHQQSNYDEGSGHILWSITVPPIRQSPLASDATPMASRSCGPERRSRSMRARRWSGAGSYQIVSRANGTSSRSIASSSGASR